MSPASPARPWLQPGVTHEAATVSYIDAGYAIAFGVLAAYAAVLWRRRHRLERAATRQQGRTEP